MDRTTSGRWLIHTTSQYVREGAAGSRLLQFVKEVTADELLIGNNRGKFNGWVPRALVAGRVTEVHGGS